MPQMLIGVGRVGSRLAQEGPSGLSNTPHKLRGRSGRDKASLHLAAIMVQEIHEFRRVG